MPSVGVPRRVFGFLYALIGLCTTIAYGFCASFLILPWALLPRGRRERYAIQGARWFAWMALRPLLFARVGTVGLELLPRRPGYLVVANHRSWVDVALLILHTSSQGIAKREVSYIPFFGPAGHVSGAIFFDRRRKDERARVVDEALRLLRGGANLHVFPEGTRTRTGRLEAKVHLRLVQACFEAGIDVVPACVWGTERSIPAEGIFVWPFQRVGLEVEAPLERRQFADAGAYAEACWARVVAMARRHGADEPLLG